MASVWVGPAPSSGGPRRRRNKPKTPPQQQPDLRAAEPPTATTAPPAPDSYVGSLDTPSEPAESGEAQARARLAQAWAETPQQAPSADSADELLQPSVSTEELANRSLGAVHLNSFLMGSMGEDTIDDAAVGDPPPAGAEAGDDVGPRVVGGKYLTWARSSAFGAGGELDDHVGSVPPMAGMSKTTRVELSKARTWPAAYRKQTQQERIALGYVDNFDRQFAQLYPLRRRLMLAMPNECQVDKFVCTSLRPTQTPYDELYTLDGVASFVADHLIYEPLPEATKIPAYLPSPATVLDWQVGDAFDFAMVAVSLLLGVGYDAYVVYGTAVYSITVNETVSAAWPHLGPRPESPPPPPAPAPPKFVVQTRPTLRSKFVERMAGAPGTAGAAPPAGPGSAGSTGSSNRHSFEVGFARPLTATKSDADDKLHGKRVHAWVLVKAGARGVQRDTFMEPSRGVLLPLDTELYTSVEGVFNDTNFYANVQAPGPLGALSFDLTSIAAWEPVFVDAGSAGLTGPDTHDASPLFASHASKKALATQDALLAAEEHVLAKAAGIDMFGPSVPSLAEVTLPPKLAAEAGALKSLGCPPSWVLPLGLELAKFEERYPGGAKSILHSRLKVELFGPYLRSDGLVRRLTHYADERCDIVFRVDETFAHRRDRLVARELHPYLALRGGLPSDPTAESFVEHFAPGRDSGLKKLTVRGEAGVASLVRLPQRKARKSRRLVACYDLDYYPEGRASHDRLTRRIIHVGTRVEEEFCPDARAASLGGELVTRRTALFGTTRAEILDTRPTDVIPTEDSLTVIHESLARRADVADVNADVASRKFKFSTGELAEVFHLIDGHIYPSSIRYHKHAHAHGMALGRDDTPSVPDDYTDPVETSARPTDAPRSKDALFRRYIDMLRSERAAVEAVLDAGSETKATISSREKERDRCLLVISVYDTLRRKPRRTAGQDPLSHGAAAALRSVVDVPDELVDDPFAVFFHGKLPTSAAHAHAIKNEALEFHRDRIISQVLIIESKMANIRQHLQEREATIIRNQDHTSAAQVQQFAEEKIRLNFRLRVLKMRKDGILKTYRRKFKAIARMLWEHPVLAPWFDESADPADDAHDAHDTPDLSGAAP